MDDPATPSTTNQSALRSSSELNLPSTMSGASPSIEPRTPSSHIERLINAGYQPSPSRTIYSDRFIPSRTGSNFALFDISSSANSPAEGREDSSSAYATLLRAALFGTDAGVFLPGTPDKFMRLDGRSSSMYPQSRNIFRYKTETRRSMPSLMPFGFEDSLPGVSHGPVKTPRKVPRSPYKVHDHVLAYVNFFRLLIWFLWVMEVVVLFLGFGCPGLTR